MCVTYYEVLSNEDLKPIKHLHFETKHNDCGKISGIFLRELEELGESREALHCRVTGSGNSKCVPLTEYLFEKQSHVSRTP
jgi:hypothetical protein